MMSGSLNYPVHGFGVGNFVNVIGVVELADRIYNLVLQPVTFK